MTNHTRLILFKIGLTILISFSSLLSSKGTENPPQDDILKKTLGQIQSWDDNPYLLFTCRGSNFQDIFIADRTFLIDKKNKNVRLETVDKNQKKLVAFFNFEEQKIHKLYLNKVDISDKKDSYNAPILQQFQEDCKKLLLPIFLSQNYSGTFQYEQKINEGERIHQIKFSSFNIWNINIPTGHLNISSKYEITQIALDNDNLTLSQQKDIGSGITIPTEFKSTEAPKNIIFTTIAAFMFVDQNKFIDI